MVCEGCGHWVWEDRKVPKCYMCGGFFPGFGPPDHVCNGAGGSPDDKAKPVDSPSIEPLLPLIEAMGSVPDLEPFVALLQQLVPPQPGAKKAGWKESKQRVDKASKEVQKLEGN